MQRARRVTGTVAGLLVLCGCAQQRDEAPPDQGDAIVTIDPVRQALFQSMLEAHNERVEEIQTIVATGSVQLRWKDETGNHLENGQCQIWSQWPDAFSMRISKVSQDLFWIGADGEHLWMFDLYSDPTTLEIRPAAEIPVFALGQTYLPISSTSMMELAGLHRLNPIDDALWLPSLLVDPGEGRVGGIATGRNATYRVVFDETTGRIESIQWLAGTAEAPEVVVDAQLEQDIRIEMAGRSELRWPIVARRIRVIDTTGQSELLLTFETMSTITDGEPMHAVFSVETLRPVLRPEVVYEPDEPGEPDQPDMDAAPDDGNADETGDGAP